MKTKQKKIENIWLQTNTNTWLLNLELTRKNCENRKFLFHFCYKMMMMMLRNSMTFPHWYIFFIIILFGIIRLFWFNFFGWNSIDSNQASCEFSILYFFPIVLISFSLSLFLFEFWMIDFNNFPFNSFFLNFKILWHRFFFWRAFCVTQKISIFFFIQKAFSFKIFLARDIILKKKNNPHTTRWENKEYLYIIVVVDVETRCWSKQKEFWNCSRIII